MIQNILKSLFFHSRNPFFNKITFIWFNNERFDIFTTDIYKRLLYNANRHIKNLIITQ